MSLSSKTRELALTPAYRHALRLMAQWLEHGPTPLHRQRFALRQQLSKLDMPEIASLTRWLAWWCLSAQSQGHAGNILVRLYRLDASLAQRTEAIVPTLPCEQACRVLQKSA